MKQSVFASAKDIAHNAAASLNEGSGASAEQSAEALAGKGSNLSSSISGLLGRKSGIIKRSITSMKSNKSSKNLIGLSTDDKFNRLTTHVFHGISCDTPVEAIYELGEEIGKGAFGVVYKARDRTTGLEFCCKSIRKELLTPEVFDDIKLEAEVMMHLRGHPNIVEIMGLFEDAGHIHIVQELCTGGDLLSKVSKSLEPCSENFAAYITRSVLLVIQHCHSCGVIYRDIKPDNFLLSSDKPDAVLKATDFGISKFMKPGETTDEFMGTPTYMAPEVFNMECGFPSDIWSAGVMLYWLLSGEFPFKGSNKMQLGMQVVQQDPNMEGESWNEVSNEAKEVIGMMLTKDPEDRATVKELLAHKWFKQVVGAKTRPPGNLLLRRLRLFVKMHEFKKEALRRTTRNLDAEYLVGMRAMFGAMNVSGSGNLTLEELLSALDRQGCKADRKEVEALFKGIDVEEDGLLSFEEFSAATLNHSLIEMKGLLGALFKQFDRKRRGYISAHDLEGALQGNSKVNEKTIQKIMAQVDLNQDGKIDYAEFVVMMFGDDAGLQRLGRGKGNVWSYQNSKESTGAMRDATGQLIKAPNLSNYRKVNNPYSAAFMSTGKHPHPNRPKPSPVVLPSTTHYQKMSHRSTFSKNSDTSSIDVVLHKRSSTSGAHMASRFSGSGSPSSTLSPCSSLQHAAHPHAKDGHQQTHPSKATSHSSCSNFVSHEEPDRGSGPYPIHAHVHHASKTASYSSSPSISRNTSRHHLHTTPHARSKGSSTEGTIAAPPNNKNLVREDSGSYNLPEQDDLPFLPTSLQHQTSFASSERSSWNPSPMAPPHQQQQQLWGGRGSAPGSPATLQQQQLQQQQKHQGAGGASNDRSSVPQEGQLLRQATDVLAARRGSGGSAGRGSSRKDGAGSATGGASSNGLSRASFSEIPSPCVGYCEGGTANHRLSVGSHAQSPMPTVAQRPETGMAPSRNSVSLAKRQGSSSLNLAERFNASMPGEPPSPGGTSMSSTGPGGASAPSWGQGRCHLQSNNLGPESGVPVAGGPSDMVHASSNSLSSNSTAQHPPLRSATAMGQHDASSGGLASSSTTPQQGSSPAGTAEGKKYGWGKKSKASSAASASCSPDPSQHGRKPPPNISSRQGGPKSFAATKNPPPQAQRSTVRSKPSSRGSSTAQQQEGTNQNKVDHHKGVVDCVIS